MERPLPQPEERPPFEPSSPRPAGAEVPSAYRSHTPHLHGSRAADERYYDLYIPVRRRRKLIPFILFLLTCLSTFWVGVTNWQPLLVFVDGFSTMEIRRLLIAHWDQGLIYMGCVLAILLVHEMGHFVATLIYRVPATVPIFLPFPLNPIGTLGAVIGMQADIADRKQIFDIGIAGPLAGLVIAIPLCVVGAAQLDLDLPPGGGLAFEIPLLMRWIIQMLGIADFDPQEGIWLSQMNPYLAAAWVGLVITGLNMMPVGQLDGGHIAYAILRRRSHYLAEIIIVLAVAFMVYRGMAHLIVMVLLLLIMGTQHPPTRDDNVPLGRGRVLLGIASMMIPVLCFPPNIFRIAF